MMNRQWRNKKQRKESSGGLLLRDGSSSADTKSTMEGSCTASTPASLDTNSRTSLRVIRGRILFVLVLGIVAAAMGTAAFYLLSQGERNLAQTNFYSMSERAMDKAKEITLRKRLGTVTMTNVAANIHPNASVWPFVTIRGYEVTTQELIAASSGREMGFCPFVTPSQLPAFEDFAYDYYTTSREPEPFPNTTAMSSFGRGVWGKDPTLNVTLVPDQRYHDTGLTTSWNSSRQILAPILHHNEGPFPALLLNLRFQETRGVVIDAMLDCAEERERLLQQFEKNKKTTITTTTTTSEDDQEKEETPPPPVPVTMECGSITDMLELTSQAEGTGPGALIMQPIYASNDHLVGLISSSIVWGETLVDVFASSVSGIDCVLKTQASTYTYTIAHGVAVMKGQGDLHDTTYDDYELSITLTPEGLFSNSSAHYELFLYPNDTLFQVYSTNNPQVAMVGAVLIILLTSLFFFLYDFCVRKDISAKQELLTAKRNFMRFVSHEVRTPLNAVCMGLAMMEEELQTALVDHRAAAAGGSNNSYGGAGPFESSDPTMTNIVDVDGDAGAPAPPPTTTTTPPQKFSVKRETVSDWLSLTEEVLTNAQASVDVLSDILNYDKVENGSLKLELTKVNIWDLIHRTANEFRLSAAAKKIHFHCSYKCDGMEETVASPELLLLPTNNQRGQQQQMVVLVGDSIRITQVLRNLISNAIKFTPESGDITIKASWRAPTPTSRHPKKKAPRSYTLVSGETIQPEPAGYLELAVTDSGAGLSDDQLLQLFSSGVQFNVNQLQAGKGSGLGLFISKGIVEQHGGSLGASSKGLDRGSTFTMVLPLVHMPLPDPSLAVHSNADEAADNKAGAYYAELATKRRQQQHSEPLCLKILVVDDAPINRKLLAQLLTRRGHSCDVAGDGKECVDMIALAMEEGRRYETILLDYEMPIMNGPTAAKQIRKMGCDSFIVGITGNVMPEDVTIFKAAGANGVLPKPFQLRELESLWVEHGVSSETTTTTTTAPPPLMNSAAGSGTMDPIIPVRNDWCDV